MKPNICIVKANYYPDITNMLLKGAYKALEKYGYDEQITVPGIFEIPVTISKKIHKFDAFIALGCVIKGKTPHFNLISNTVVKAIMDLSIKHTKPIGNGIITCLNKKQALERSDQTKKNKGGEAANAVIKLLKNLN